MAFLLLAGTAGVRAQQCDVPQIGAQVFVEPGQTPEDIDGFFRLLRDNGMKVARIRMFGAHMYRGGEWDFSLYDEAFRAADKYGVRLFATLFPVTDELNDVGGFKFPVRRRTCAKSTIISRPWCRISGSMNRCGHGCCRTNPAAAGRASP